jgi:uncharacterized protein (TIGR02597 family)
MKISFKLIFACLAFASITTLSAQTVGYVTTQISGSINGTTLNLSQVALPMLNPAQITGQASGQITSVTSNTISNSSAAWTAGALAVVGSPYYVHITSGQNSGRMFLITGNTSTTLTVNSQGLDLTTQSFDVTAPSDTYEIIEGETPISLFGAPIVGVNDSVVGGTQTQFQASATDRVTINDPTTNTPLVIYYRTDATPSPGWRRIGAGTDLNTLAISPMAGVIYGRISTTPLTVLSSGTVRTTPVKQQVAELGTTILSTGFPVDTTLAGLNIENMPNWRRANVNSVTIALSDRVVLKSGASFFSYYYDGASGVNQWRRQGSGLDQGTVPIPAGSAIRIVRGGAAGVSSTWSDGVPY